jgi:hypothetical protein
VGRRNRRVQAGPAPLGVGGLQRVEDWGGEDWVVRRTTGAASASAGKTYRCPGCDQQVTSATPHVVAWPFDARPLPADDDGPTGRRHWHTPCWAARDRRGPRLRRVR